MAITSTEVQNLIGAQMGLFGMSTTYGQQVSQNVGTGAPQQFAQFGVGAVMDPRAPKDLVLGAQFGAGVAQAGVGAVNLGVGAMSMAGMFGMAPGAFDPFTGTLGAIGRGYRSGMAAGGMGAGVARGVGMGGLAMGGYMAAGSALNWATNQVLQGAQEGLRINTMLSQQATRGNMPMMGGINQPGQAAGVTSMIRGMSDPMGMGVGDLTNLMGAGLQGGMFRDVGSMQQFRSRFGELKNSVQQIVQTLQVTQQEGLALMQQMRGMGFQGVGQAGAAGQRLGGMASAMGMDPMAMVNAAAGGSQMARRMGMTGAFGAQMTAGMTGRIGAGNMSGMFSDAALSEASGGLPVGMAGPALGGQFANAAMQFTSSRAGFQLMGALMDPATGQLDPGRVSAFQMNEYSGRQIRSMARSNLGKRGVRTALGARHGSLSQELIGDLGPEGLIGGYAQAQLQGRKLRAGENMADATSMLIQQATGLGEQQAGMIQQLITASPAMKQAAEQQMRDTLSEQKRQNQMNQMYSIEGIKKRIVSAYVEPIRAPLRQLGANITNWGQDVFGGAIDWMLGGARPGPGPPSKITPLGGAIYQGSALGGPAGGYGAGGMDPGGFSMGGQDFTMGGPQPIGGPAGLAADYFGLQGQYNPQITMALGGATLGGMALRGPSARLMASAPEALVRGFRGGGNFRQALRRGAGGVLSAGLRGGAGGFGRMLPYAAGLGLAGDVGMNVIPEAARSFGIAPDYGGGLGGEPAQALSNLYRGGYFKDIAGFSTAGVRPTAGSIPVDIGQSAMSTWQGQGGGVFQVQAAPLPGILKEAFQAMAGPQSFLASRRDLTQTDMHKLHDVWAKERQLLSGQARAMGGGPVDYARNLTNIITNRSGVGGKIGEGDFAGQLALLSAVAPEEGQALTTEAQRLLGAATSVGRDAEGKAEASFLRGAFGTTGTTTSGTGVTSTVINSLTGPPTEAMTDAADNLANLVNQHTKVGQALLALGKAAPGLKGNVLSAGSAAIKAVDRLNTALNSEWSSIDPNVRSQLGQYVGWAKGTGTNRAEGQARLRALGQGAQWLAVNQRALVSEQVFSRAAALREQQTDLISKKSALTAVAADRAGADTWTKITDAVGAYATATETWATTLRAPGSTATQLTNAGRAAAASVKGLVKLSMDLPAEDRGAIAQGVGGIPEAIMLEGGRVAKALKGRGGVSGVRKLLSPLEGAAEFFTAERTRRMRKTGATTDDLALMMKIIDPSGTSLSTVDAGTVTRDLAAVIGRSASDDQKENLAVALAGVASTGGARVKGTSGGGGGRSGGVVLQKFTERMAILLGKVDVLIAKSRP